jgi:hypothetical protein
MGRESTAQHTESAPVCYLEAQEFNPRLKKNKGGGGLAGY